MENYVKTYNGECPKDKDPQLGKGDTGQGQTAQELVAETEEAEMELLPKPLRDPRPKKYEVTRLT